MSRIIGTFSSCTKTTTGLVTKSPSRAASATADSGAACAVTGSEIASPITPDSGTAGTAISSTAGKSRSSTWTISKKEKT